MNERLSAMRCLFCNAEMVLMEAVQAGASQPGNLVLTTRRRFARASMPERTGRGAQRHSSLQTQTNNEAAACLFCVADYGGRMQSRADKYRKQTEECKQEAARATTRIAKRRWLRTADFYSKMAIEAARQPRQTNK